MAKDSNLMDLFDNIESEDSLAPDLSTLSSFSRALIADYLTRLIRQRNKPCYVFPAPISKSPVFKSFPVGSPAAPVLSLDTTLIQLPNRLLCPQTTFTNRVNISIGVKGFSGIHLRSHSQSLQPAVRQTRTPIGAAPGAFTSSTGPVAVL